MSNIGMPGSQLRNDPDGSFHLLGSSEGPLRAVGPRSAFGLASDFCSRPFAEVTAPASLQKVNHRPRLCGNAGRELGSEVTASG